MTGIELFHRYPARQYYDPIGRLVAEGKADYFSTYQFELRHNPRDVVENVRFLLSAARGRDAKLLLGAEPFDIRVPYFEQLARRNDMIYHTSWPFWSGDRVPKRPWVERQRREWRSFVQRVPTVAVTRAATEAVEDFGGDAIHIPHGVDTTVYSPDKGADAENQRVLFVGELTEQKGIRDLVAAAERLDSDGATFQFVGQGPLADYLREYSEPASIEHLGYVADDERLAELYATADVHALPSYPTEYWEELFGMVIIEAMAAGTPTVATDCVGPREVVEDGETGFVVERRDVEAIADAIDSLLANPELRAEMGARARRVAEETYDMSHIAAQWYEILNL